MSSASSPTIPYLLLGKLPSHITACTEISKPDHEVILHKSSTDDARAALPALLAGGEINGKTYPAIKLVVMGGGFSHNDFLSVYENVPGARDVPWLRPQPMRPGSGASASASAPPLPPSGGGGGPPSAEVVAARLRRALDEHRWEFWPEEAGELREREMEKGKGKGIVWWF